MCQIKLACVNLAKQYMVRVVSEIDGLGCKNDEQKRETALFKRLKEQNREVLFHQGVKFAFRVHQVQKKLVPSSLFLKDRASPCSWRHAVKQALSFDLSLQEGSLLIAWILFVS
jgi:hypothetical protein